MEIVWPVEMLTGCAKNMALSDYEMEDEFVIFGELAKVKYQMKGR